MKYQKEADIMRAVQVAASEHGHRLFRNNIGVCKDAKGNYIRYGVCNPGGSDLVGWTVDGRFLAVEVKGPKGKLTQAQHNFLTEVERAGGVAVSGCEVGDILFQINTLT